jgi:4-hydroxy-3-polyprenylbenzoate decarboxylase
MSELSLRCALLFFAVLVIPGFVKIITAQIHGGKKKTCFLFYIRNAISLYMANSKIVVGVSGASGSIYAIRLLERLQGKAETHLILTRSAEKTLFLETGKLAADLKSLASYSHPIEDISSRLASGSFQIDAMVVAPCSIHTMSSIAAGISSNLLIRAADVCLKERRKLVLMVRETPFHLGHLRSMTALAEMGAIIAPPIPGFYNKPETVLDLVDHSVDRVLDLLRIPDASIERWIGPGGR